jgi:hypothetical protein
MAHVVVGDALCFASAGTVLCFTARTRWREQQEHDVLLPRTREQPPPPPPPPHHHHQIELAACECAVVVGTAADTVPGPSFFDETEIPAAVAVAISSTAAAGGVRRGT